MNISEGYGYPIYGLGGASFEAKDAAVAAPEIQPGQSDIIVNVILTYRLR